MRRGIRQSDVFLVFSSTIAFEAAVIDSVRKDARSKQWDKVIAEGKQQVEAVDIDQKSRIQGLLDRAEQRLVEDADDQYTPSPRPEKEFLDWTWPGIFASTAARDRLRIALGFEDWKGVQLSMLKDLTTSELRELLMDKRILRFFYGGPDCENLEPGPVRFSLSMKKTVTLEWSVAKLVMRMLRAICGDHAYKHLTGVPTDRLASIVPLAQDGLSLSESWNQKLAQANTTLNELRAYGMKSRFHENVERPTAPRYDPGLYADSDEMAHLNTTLHATLQHMKAEDELSSLLAKICQQLLVSRCPPDVHTYNLLLVRFCELEQSTLVHLVLESMQEAHIRPNEITHATVLRFFTVTQNPAEFTLYHDRMSGYKRGLALVDPNRTLSPLVESQVHRFGNSLQNIALKARMNQEVFTALIVGFLRFFKHQQAMYWYRAMIDEGWRPSTELLVALLRDSCIRLDWYAGMAVWQEFTKEALKVTKVGYEWMLRLCQRCEQDEVYSAVLQEGIHQGVLSARLSLLSAKAKSEDVGILLDQAEDDIVVDQDRKLDVPIRKRLRQLRAFAIKEGQSHLLDNALSNVMRDGGEANATVRSLAGDAGRLKALRAGIAKHEKAFNDLSASIVDTVDEINALLPRFRIERRMIKFGLSISLSGIHSQDIPASVQTLYDRYKNTSVGRLERDTEPVLIPAPPNDTSAMYTHAS